MSKTTSAILIILAIAVYYSFTSPQYDMLQQSQAKVNQYQDAIDNASKIAQTRDALAAAAQAIPAAEKDRLSKALPENVDAVGLARELDTIGSQYGISIKSVAIENNVNPTATLIVLPEGQKPYEKAVVSFSFIATYPTFVKFLADVEKSLRIMDVRSASFKAGDSGLYEHDLTVETYWLKK